MKICFVVSEDWYFCSHRLPLAEEALRRGWDVVLVARMGACRDQLERLGVRIIHLDIDRGGLNPLSDLRYCAKLVRIYRSEQPDIIHHVAMKPCLMGSIAVWLSGRRCCMVNAIAGLGTTFSSDALKIRVVRLVVRLVFKCFLARGSSRVIVQNMDDYREFEEGMGLGAAKLKLIRGSGVDMAEFSPAEENVENEEPLVVLVSRLLMEKGIPELIDAARLLKQRGAGCRVALVGDADPGNPLAVPEEMLSVAESDQVVELWGRRSNIADIYRQADVAVLPSYYREGIPKTLLEAAASGLPIVTTDSVGCREVVDDGVNGFLVPVRQFVSLADALEKLVSCSKLRREMGRRSREKALKEFGIEQVVTETFSVYECLIDGRAKKGAV